MKRLFTSSMMLVALTVFASARDAQAGGLNVKVGGGGFTMAKSGSGGGGNKKGFSLHWGNGQNQVKKHIQHKPCHIKKYYHNGHWHTKKFCATPVVIKPAVHLRRIPAGATITIPCHNLGHAEGYVYLHVGGLKLPAEILRWTPGAVTLRLPPMNITYATKAHLDIYRYCGTLAKQLPILLVARTDVIVH